MRLTFPQLLIFIVCLMAGLMLDFYLGARFGPEMLWGIKIDKSGSVPVLPQNIPDGELEALLQKEAPELGFHDVLLKKGKETEVIIPPTPVLPVTPVLPATPVLPVETAEKKEEKEEAVKAEEKKLALAKVQEEEKNAKKVEVKKSEVKVEVPPLAQVEVKKETQAAVKPAPPEGKFTLQLGSFAEIDRAKEWEKKFTEQGLSVVLKEVEIPNKGKWYRVYSGTYSSQGDAIAAQTKIYQDFQVMPVVIKQ